MSGTPRVDSPYSPRTDVLLLGAEDWRSLRTYTRANGTGVRRRTKCGVTI